MLAGQVNFAITNIGTIQHELLVFKTDLPPSAVPLDKNGNIIEDGPGMTLVSHGDKIDPGKTQARVVDLTKPGTYLFVCNLPGHFKAGMSSVVTVTPEREVRLPPVCARTSPMVATRSRAPRRRVCGLGSRVARPTSPRAVMSGASVNNR